MDSGEGGISVLVVGPFSWTPPVDTLGVVCEGRVHFALQVRGALEVALGVHLEVQSL